MKLTRLAARMAATVAALSAAGIVVFGESAIDASFQKFWDAKSPADAARQVDAVLKTGVSYDDALQRLKQGRSYGPQKTGVAIATNRTDDKVEHYYAVNVPAGYDPAKR